MTLLKTRTVKVKLCCVWKELAVDLTVTQHAPLPVAKQNTTKALKKCHN